MVTNVWLTDEVAIAGQLLYVPWQRKCSGFEKITIISTVEVKAPRCAELISPGGAQRGFPNDRRLSQSLSKSLSGVTEKRRTLLVPGRALPLHAINTYVGTCGRFTLLLGASLRIKKVFNDAAIRSTPPTV